MAKEEKKEDIGEEEGPPQKKGSSLKMVIVFVLLLALGGGGFFVWQKFLNVPAGEGGEVATKKAKEKQEVSVFKMDSFVVNLAKNAGRRYLKMTMELELDDKTVESEIKQKMPQIRDSILILLSGKSFEDINTIGGKYKLKDEIITRINTILIGGRIRQIYFTEFVIQ